MTDIEPNEETESEGESALDKLRDSPVGMNDPMIVGDAGPTDIPPGVDGDDEALPTGLDGDEEEPLPPA